jgi:dipeptidyl aminopeptidase/acylaminoacyl peptidase
MVTRGVYPDGRDLGILLRASGAVWSPSGTQFAYVTPSGMELNLVDLQGEERTIYASTFEWQPLYAWPVWSPDGRRIAVITVAWCGGSDRISWLVVIDVAEGKISPPYGPFDFWEASGTEDGPKYITLPKTLRWSPDGRFIMVSWDKVVAIDAETGDLERISDTPVVAEWAPGGNAIYYFEIKDPDDPDARSLGAFHVRQLGAAAPVKLLVEKQVAALGLAGAGGSILGLMALSPTGSKLAFTPGEVDSGMGRLQIYGLTEEPALALDKPLKTFETEGPIAALEWAPDETSLAAIVRGDQGATLMVLDLTKDVWTTLATPTIDLEYLDDLGRILSWAR